MNSRLKKELPELVANKVISQDVANAIESYYTTQKEASPNRLFTIFGVLGATLVGLGIILILAHNWDSFPRAVKTAWAFLPLVIGQAFVGYSILGNKSSTWKESSGVFLFFAVGSSMALISQIYNIPGNLSTFLLTWVLLCSPLMYLLNSRATAILHMIFSTYYVFEYGYSYSSNTPWYYLLLLVLAMPFYLKQLRDLRTSNMTSIFNWIIPLSITVCLGAFIGNGDDELGFFIYLLLFGIFYNLGKIPYFQNQKLRRNGYLIIGSLGTITTLLFLSFRWYWKEVVDGIDVSTRSIVIVLTLFAITLAILIYSYTKNWIKEFNLFRYVFIVFTALFFIGTVNATVPTVLVNFLVLTLGLIAIRIGADKFHFGILNYGLLIVTALVICRFFDTNMTFVVRGLLFVIVGVGFFLTNYVMLRRQKSKITKK